MLIQRYLYKEIWHTFFAVILVVLLIAVSNKLVRLVAQAASGDIPPNILFQVILFQIPELLAFLLPIGLFLAILLCLSRFYADNEIPVMLACGVSWRRLTAISVSMGLVIMLLSGSLTCYWSPQAAQYREQLLHSEGPMLLVQTIAPGRFHAFHKDNLVFYVADLNAAKSELKSVFIAEQPKGDLSNHDSWSVLTAQTGNVFSDQNNGFTYVKLTHGKRYNGTPGETDYSIIEFEQYQRLLESTTTPQGLYYHRTMPTQMLWQNTNPSNTAELQWRLSVPLSAPLLALLAVPLSRVPPRSGRFGRLFTAVILCIIYYNLLTLSKRWVASGALSPYIGVWWVHILLLVGALCFLAKTSGRWHQGYHKLTSVRILRKMPAQPGISTVPPRAQNYE